MVPRFEVLQKKRLIGKSMLMSYNQNTTPDLWRSFMMNRKQIANTIGTDLYSIQFYPPILDWSRFSPAIIFEKWAAIEVEASAAIPEGFREVFLQKGLYAVFHYKGGPEEGEKVFKAIFGDWLPSSDYTIDDRPHFEVLGSKYVNHSPDSEEEIWIPVKLKA
ncbi:MAG TPA: GyrI-like domain-containing protein [Bacteroidia bacterium]|jgi:AraC family transcriptional regulator|nr:GyrI-like domain-containing protein [Bacteroidia bacterium]